MDPLSITASIPALIELASKLINFLYRVKNASSEQTKLRNEVAIVSGLLTALDMRGKDMKADDEGFATMRALAVRGGAVDQCKESLERLRGKTGNDNVSRIERFGRDLAWHFKRDEVNEALTSLERLKTSLGLALTNDVGILLQKMEVNADVLIRDVSELKDDFKSQRVEKECQKIGDWLSPFDFRAMQQEILHKCHTGTGKWMLESDKFQQWLSSHNETLWCPGIPGAGKTYLASIMIEYLQRQTSSKGQDAVLCLFCNFDKQANQTAYNFMGALLKQLAQASRTPSESIRSIYDARGEDRRSEFGKLAHVFRMELERFSKTYIIIDALDEVSENADIRTILLRELQTCPVNLLVTSRHDPIIKKLFSETQLLEICATDEDIRSYISARIGQEELLNRQIRSFPPLENNILTRIVASAKGMFLLARFHMDEISHQTKPKRVEEALQKLPQGLNENYDRIIDRIKSQGSDSWNLARKVLMWISNALWPLNIGALQEAVAVENGMNSMGIRDLDDMESMISVCAGLVILEEGQEMSAPRLVHYTLQEYLMGNQDILSPNPHAEVARACLTFLSFDDFSNKAPDCWLRWQHKSRFRYIRELACSPYQFTGYAALLWGAHARRAGEIELMKETLDFLSRPANVAYNLLVKMAVEWVEDWKQVLYEELSLRDPGFLRMLLVVKLDLVFVLVELLKTRTRPAENVLDPVISGLACDAAKQGCRQIVKLLLTQKDVDWNMCWIYGENLLMILADQDDEDNLRTLLQTKSCSVNIFGDLGSALERAVGRGNISITRLLLEAGADVESRGYYGLPIMIVAKYSVVHESRHEMMDLLLEYKADINAHGQHGNTALHCAASGSFPSAYTVEYLVSKGASPNLPDERGETPLNMAKSIEEPQTVYTGTARQRKLRGTYDQAIRVIAILHKAGGKTAEEMLQPSIGEQGSHFPSEWLDRLEEIKELNSVYLKPPSICRCGRRTLPKDKIDRIEPVVNAFQRYSNPSSAPSSSLVDTERWKSKFSIYYPNHSKCRSS